MVAVGARQSLQNLSSWSRVKCLTRPSDQNENNSAKSSATTGCPMKCSVFRVELLGSSATSATLDRTISITGINTVITEIAKPGIFSVDSPPSCAASGLSGLRGIRGEIHDAYS